MAAMLQILMTHATAPHSARTFTQDIPSMSIHLVLCSYST